ncbi:MAG: LemA family protein [Phycisphaerae bacterium]
MIAAEADMAKTVLIPAGGVALGLLLLWLALRAGSRKRLIDNTPTCKTAGVYIGMVELKGTAESERPLRSFLAEMPCVWYSWMVEEHWSKTVTETYRDNKGNTQTRTRHESGWKTVADGGEQSVFFLQDDMGVIRVDPDGAKVESESVFHLECRPGDPLYYGKGPAMSVADSDHRRLFTERAVPLHAPLYVLGQSRLREDVVAPEIAKDRSAPMFLISTRSEEQISRGMAVQFWLLGVIAVVFAVAGWVVSDAAQDRDPRLLIARYVPIAIAAVAAWVLGWVWMVYNSMAGLRQRVDQGWANIDVQLKRRADLIPNLVAAVKGYRDHEQAVQQHVALMRAQAAATRPGVAGPDPQACGKAILAIQEAYPQLKADQAFLKLQTALADTEQRIALAREFFNSIAAFYNARLQIIPDRFVCALAGLRPQALLAAADFERAPVQVNLSR